MSPQLPPDDQLRHLVTLAECQYGLVTRTQLAELCLSDSAVGRLVTRGVLRRVRPGVYRLLGAGPSRQQDITAVRLWAGEEAFASHRTGAEIHGLPGAVPPLIEITTQRSVRSSDVLVHRRATWPPGDVTVVEGIRVSTIPRTLLDLASVVHLGTLARVLDATLHRGVSLDSISRRLEATAVQGRNGTANLRKLIHERTDESAAVESPLERDFLTLVRDRNMDEPVAQYPVFVDGHLIARLDFAYPELKIGIELDGYAFHSSREAFERDRRRLTELVNECWHMLVFTRPQLQDHPAWVERAVLKARALALARAAKSG
ncbi:MAG TPA: type IV toxin-antitoxin system AbiEi family antitoxin domain-containing protein [Actinomycetota bacterium]|nr:type IV toxin-antitoxin system AbiEi family antitoxin domain-containing protein [Actinomycetota bacterium]